MESFYKEQRQQAVERYQKLKEEAVQAWKKGDVEYTLDLIQCCAQYASSIPLGILCDDELEQILCLILQRKDRKVFNFSPPKLADVFAKEELHVAYLCSFLNDGSWHPNFLKPWVTVFKSHACQQTLYVTHGCFGSFQYPRIRNFLLSHKVSINELSEPLSPLSKINHLRDRLEKDPPDLMIIFCSHYYDVIFMPALASLTFKPLVFFFNHGDHTFWLGKRIIDHLLEYRVLGAKISQKYRDISVNSYFIPFTVDSENLSQEDKSIPFIPQGVTLSLSVGSYWKIENTSEFNYFKTIEAILKKLPNHYHLLVTTNIHPDHLRKKHGLLYSEVNQRFIILENVSPLEPFYRQADLLIDTFPWTGGMVRVEAVANGLPVISFQHPQNPLLSIDDYFPPSYPFRASTEEEVIRLSIQLIEHPAMREKVGKELQNYFHQHFSPSCIRARLEYLFQGNEKPLLLQIPSSEQSVELDFDFLYKHRKETFYTYRSLLHLLSARHNSSIQHRMESFWKAWRNHNFSSMEEISMSFVEALLGWRGRFLSQTLYQLFLLRSFLLQKLKIGKIHIKDVQFSDEN